MENIRILAATRERFGRPDEGLLRLLICAAALASGAARAFDADGQTDIVWQNRATGQTGVWLMNLANFVTAAPITNDLGGDWTIAAAADFNRDGQTDLLWRSPSSGRNEIWSMNRTNRIARNALAIGSPDYSVVGAGDFNGDGYADILWRDHARNLTGVWFLQATHWNGQVGWITRGGDSEWRAVATGDCNNDGDADVYWRHSGDGSNAVWLMRGTNLVRVSPLRKEPDLGFRLAAIGSFNPIGNSDLLWRHTNGQNVVWLMQGTNYLSSVSLRPEPNPDWQITGVGGYANQMLLSATADPVAARLILSWRYGPTNLPTLQRRVVGETAWATQAVNYVPYRFTNSNLTVGQRYEFDVGGEYLLAGVQAAPVEHRGKVILIVENAVAKSLARELDGLQADLVGDGWSVIRTNVPRHNDRVWSANTNAIASIKSFIAKTHSDDPSAKAVLLLGHVPIPYSGFHNPDGHGHRALPADGYYGDVDGVFSDNSVDFPTYLKALIESRHDNRMGDGKFDQNSFPTNRNGVARLELAVGRIDFAKLPVFRRQSEAALLRSYLNKIHRYRHKQLTAPERVIVGTFLPTGLNWEAYGQALKNSSRWFGNAPGSVVEGDPLAPTHSAVWGIIGGYGLPYGVCGPSWIYHEAKDLEPPARQPRVLFCNVFASYCLDPDYTNNFLRAFLRPPDSGLATTWFRPVPMGNIPLSFEPLGLGEPLGTGLLRMINEGPEKPARNTYLTLFGDPTLRLQILAPPSHLAARGRRPVSLTWTASPEPGAEYFAYRSTNDLNGPWTKLTPGAIRGTEFTDLAAPAGAKVYQIRALKLVTTGSGSFTNLSQGIFVKVP